MTDLGYKRTGLPGRRKDKKNCPAALATGQSIGSANVRNAPLSLEEQITHVFHLTLVVKVVYNHVADHTLIACGNGGLLDFGIVSGVEFVLGIRLQNKHAAVAFDGSTQFVKFRTIGIGT